MKCSQRNKQTLYYALYQGKTEIVDEYGNATGQFTNTYGSVLRMKANVSPARGTSDIEQFGINANYSKTMVVDEMGCPIDENSILWIGKEPTSTHGSVITMNPHNYVITQVAKSLNSITYAIKEVEVTNA